MSSQSTTIKPKLLSKTIKNLCEIDNEYPSSKKNSSPRHLCACDKSSKIPEHTNYNKLSNIVTTEHHHQHEKDSNKQSLKQEKDEIEFYQLKLEEDEINNKLYRKHRYQFIRINDNDEEKRDNTN